MPLTLHFCINFFESLSLKVTRGNCVRILILICYIYLGSAALWAFPLSWFDLVLLESPSLRACVNPGSQQRQPRLVQHAHRRTLGATLRVLTLNVPRCLPQLTSCRSPVRRRARSSPHASLSLSLTAMTSHNRVWCACIASTEHSFSPSVKQLIECYCCTVRKIHAVMFPYEYTLVLICTVLPMFLSAFSVLVVAFALFINFWYWMKVK